MSAPSPLCAAGLHLPPMATIREIKNRMKAVSNIKRITRTMQMIATAKFAAAQTRATAAKPYTEGIFQLVQELAATAGDINHPLISGPSGDLSNKPELVLIITSDRGLCGPYNGGVLRMALRRLRSIAGPVETELVGKKGVAYLKFQGMPATRHHTHFGDNPHREEIDHLAQDYMDRFSAGELSAVRVAYTRYHSAGKQSPEILQLLPLKPPSETGEGKTTTGPSALDEVNPEADELLAELLPETVRTTLSQ